LDIDSSDLDEWLQEQGMTEHKDAALAWCLENGAASVQDLNENTDALAEFIGGGLKPLQAKRLKKQLEQGGREQRQAFRPSMVPHPSLLASQSNGRLGSILGKDVMSQYTAPVSSVATEPRIVNNPNAVETPVAQTQVPDSHITTTIQENPAQQVVEIRKDQPVVETRYVDKMVPRIEFQVVERTVEVPHLLKEEHTVRKGSSVEVPGSTIEIDVPVPLRVVSRLLRHRDFSEVPKIGLEGPDRRFDAF